MPTYFCRIRNLNTYHPFQAVQASHLRWGMDRCHAISCPYIQRTASFEYQKFQHFQMTFLGSQIHRRYVIVHLRICTAFINGLNKEREKRRGNRECTKMTQFKNQLWMDRIKTHKLVWNAMQLCAMMTAMTVMLSTATIIYYYYKRNRRKNETRSLSLAEMWPITIRTALHSHAQYQQINYEQHELRSAACGTMCSFYGNNFV